MENQKEHERETGSREEIMVEHRIWALEFKVSGSRFRA